MAELPPMESQIGLFDSPTHTLHKTEEPHNPGQKWNELLQEELRKEYYLELKAFVKGERAKGKIIYPSDNEIFNALSMTNFSKVKVVILGQDPYHGLNQAHGLCFSVRRGVPAPPSLINIFEELKNDLGISPPAHGCLEDWAKQGVLLLNATLTVEAGIAGSHQGKGWERFTDNVVSLINERSRGVVFLLWGSYAQKKGEMIDTKKHYILKAPHPSPLSAHRGFFGCRHFSRANKILRDNGKEEINWGAWR